MSEPQSRTQDPMDWIRQVNRNVDETKTRNERAALLKETTAQAGQVETKETQ